MRSVVSQNSDGGSDFRQPARQSITGDIISKIEIHIMYNRYNSWIMYAVCRVCMHGYYSRGLSNTKLEHESEDDDQDKTTQPASIVGRHTPLMTIKCDCVMDAYKGYHDQCLEVMGEDHPRFLLNQRGRERVALFLVSTVLGK